jgi:hypothetical protein
MRSRRVSSSPMEAALAAELSWSAWNFSSSGPLLVALKT